MSKKKNPKSGAGLTLIGLIFLSSCAKIDYKHNCPIYPAAGEKVAAELEKASYDDFPATWEWIGRINKLRQELEMCQKSGL